MLRRFADGAVEDFASRLQGLRLSARAIETGFTRGDQQSRCHGFRVARIRRGDDRLEFVEGVNGVALIVLARQ